MKKTSPLASKSKAAAKTATTRGVFSEGAIRELRDAIARGGGSAAQFSHPELGGYGQWMRGGMIMIGDMGNDTLKARVAALAAELAEEPASPEYREADETRSESKDWWPKSYRSPAATGGQNDFRYAYFPEQNVLIVEESGKRAIYDTTGHTLHGFGQRQTPSSAFELRSGRRSIRLDELPRKEADRAAVGRRRKGRRKD